MSHTTTRMLLRRAQLEGRVRQAGAVKGEWCWTRVVDVQDDGQKPAGT